MFKSTLFYLILLCGVDLYGQSGVSTIVLKTEQRRFDAMMQRDTVTLQGLLADDLIYIHSNALKEHKLEHIHSIASGKIVYQSMQREEAMVRTYGKIAISSGTIKVKGLLAGNPFEVRMLYTAVYQKKKKGWLLVHWQSTRLP